MPMQLKFKHAVIWDANACKIHRCFGETCCVQLQGQTLI